MTRLTGRSRVWRAAERLALTVGVACLAMWAMLTVVRTAGARYEIGRFTAAQAATRVHAERPDFALWSPERIQAWRDTFSRDAPAALGVLRISRIGLEVPILEGTDDWTLNRAVGHIAETAAPGSDGNCGIAGHRDGFFRGLKDVRAGDEIAIETGSGQEVYRVERMWVVNPEDVSVLDPTSSRSITLVTCYPFYFVGSAPQRFIVRAGRAASAHTGTPH